MNLRTIKILLSLTLALLALIYATQNVVNLDKAFVHVAYVLGQVDHEAYPDSLAPAITAPALVWSLIGVIILLEFAAGLVLLKGTYDLWRARGTDAMGFDTAKRNTLLGAGLGMLVWFGLFHVFGGALYQQWQTQLGDGSLRGAFWFGAIMALTAMYISVTADD